MYRSTMHSAQLYGVTDLQLAPCDVAVPGNPYDAPYVCTFHGPQGKVHTVPGYYDGGRGFMVRFSPTLAGSWRYRSRSPIAALDGHTGEALCDFDLNEPIHGALTIDPQHRHHFVYQDGERCFLMGYEADWLLLIDQGAPELGRVAAFLQSIQRAGVNMVTVNVYAYSCPGWLSEQQEADRRYVKPSLSPWVGGQGAPCYDRLDMAFFKHMDRMMLLLLHRGILVHLMMHVYNKQVPWPALGSPDDDRYWRYVVARYQAFPNVIWDPAKESYYQPAEYIRGRIALVRQLDGYRRLITVHDANTPEDQDSPWARRWYDPRKELSDTLADFKSDQVRQDWYEDALRCYEAAPRPYLNVEYGYEQGVEDLPPYGVRQDWREVLRRTWLVTMGGGYVNYYYSNTAWNLFAPTPEPPGYAAHQRYRAFWLGTRYWLLAPGESPFGVMRPEGVYCRADPGREYVVFDERGAGFTLPSVPTGPYRARWFHPLTGEQAAAPSTDAVGATTWRPPWGPGQWAVLHLSRED